MRRLREPSGSSLIEILFTITILMIGFLGVQSLGVGIVRGNLFSDRVTSATTLAQDKLEGIRKLGYGGISGTTVTTTEPYNSIANYPFYKRVTSIEVGIPSAGMKKVSVTVFWSIDTKSVTVASYVAE